MDEIAQLIKTICSGTPGEKSRAMERLYALQQRPLRRQFMTDYRLSFERADELVQELMMRVLKSACSFSGSGGGKGWILKLGGNLFIDGYRRSTREVQTQPIPEDENGMMQIPEPTDRGSAEEHQMLDLVEQAMEKLSATHPRLAAALNGVVVEGWDGKTLADRLDLKSVGAGYQMIYEARSKLREYVRRLTLELERKPT